MYAQDSESTMTPALSPAVPDEVTFCGKPISLDRADMFERFDRELTSLVYSHSTTLLLLKRANKYFPVMAPILKANGIPEDFLYLACVESSLNHRALSPAKAAGFWQFIPATAKEYGLEVSDDVDERFDLEKSTLAACKFFKKAYARYGDWPTVMAAFNGGMARITKELGKQQQDTSFDIYLTEETSRYVFRIMALEYLFSDPARFGFILAPEQLYQPTDCDIVTVDGPIEDWSTWALEHGVSYAQLREENPWIRAKEMTNKDNKTYTVKIPSKNSLYRSTNNIKVFNDRWVKE